jgi:hypothetical protein
MRIADYRKIGMAVVSGSVGDAERAGVAHVRHVRNAIDRMVARGDELDE